MSSFFRKLGWLTRRRQKEEELLEELQFHLSEEAAERHSEAAARRDLGNLTLLREDTRAVWGWTFWERLVQDLRYAGRTMAANKAFSALAILSLGLGVGANTAIFSFMDSMLLRSLPVADPDSLVVMRWHSRLLGKKSVMRSGHGGDGFKDASGFTQGIFPYPALELMHQEDSLFGSVFGRFDAGDLTVAVRGQADTASSEFVTGDYFRGLGIHAAAGRVLLPDDDLVGAPGVAVVSFALSQKRWGSPANAAGQSILINNVPFTIVGVAPREFFGVDPGANPDIYVPMHASLLMADSRPGAGWFPDKNSYWVQIVARLKPGVSMQRAQAALAPRFRQWVDSTAENDEQRTSLPALFLQEGAGGLDMLRRQYSKPLWVLTALVGLILALACANIANLLLARCTARRREMAVRLSIGAGRRRIIRQLLTESTLLSLLGGALGIAVAIWGIQFLTPLVAGGWTKFAVRADLNWHVLAATTGLSLLTGILFGLAPAIQSTRVDLLSALKESRAGESRLGGRHSFLRINLSRVLVVSQIAITLFLLVAAGLFLRTLSNLQSIEFGFNRDHLLSFRLNARQGGHRSPELDLFYADLLKRLSAIPGVRDASLTNTPVIGRGTWFTAVSVLGKVPALTDFLMVGPGFFRTLQIPLLAGREIEERDGGNSPLAS